MDSNANWKPGDCRDKSPDSDGDLRALFGRLSPRDEELPRLDDLRRQVEARAAAEHATGRRPAGAAGWKGWNEMWNPARWSALRLAGAASLLLVVLACTVPLNYDREAGLTLDLQVSGDLEPVLRVLRQGPWSVENFNVQEEDGGRSRVQALLRDASQAELAVFEGLAGVELSSTPWEEESRGSLFTMMMDQVFNVQLNISGLSDEQINTALQEQLDAQGYPGRVSVTRSEEGGLPLVHVELESDSAAPGPLTIALSAQCDSQLTEGEWQLQGGGLPGLQLEGLEGLTEAEIRERVLAQLRAAGVNPDSVGVVIQRREDSSPDGAVRSQDLRIQVKKEPARP
ncbi:MAG: hypothetical protein WC326_03150 [Candidatus Delongbacteria bacterium]